MKEFVETLVEAVVGSSTGWEIKERLRSDEVVVLELQAADEETLRAIVGTGGSHSDAVRTLLRAAQAGRRRQYRLEIRPL